ncbi:hypothetical protein HYH02_007852 [Chlamydomonas schloesseri]|uniref:Tocopherol cyclase n=1 Tax=Chlamydomonas schloesseri TaxID=2026947 RepID=A0A835WGJ2_9CHLO|nr:hypothetical protein HYH02_007852 [Chlamydomonas schloesseri]|eukprot:KAG2447103.1 hypothetical protein HYH02_007852 [Chlamydomonas schloesseri]
MGLLLTGQPRASALVRRRNGLDGRRRLAPVRASVTTPHSGYHFDGLPRRFFEGWYWKVQLPESGQSFALIYSIEDPLGNTPQAGVGLQVMGPDDGYICQFTPDVTGFWAERNRLALGATFKAGGSSYSNGSSASSSSSGSSWSAGGRGTTTGGGGGGPRRLLPAEDFFSAVELGFQASDTTQQGRMVAAESGTAGPPLSTVPNASWSLTIKPKAGWGSTSGPTQKATAGWLSVLPIFEPHWQVMMAHGEASGWLQWGGQRYEFTNAPAYAEKNWGGGFPSKWHWIQCNSFEGQPGLSVTAVGARRALLLGLQGVEEDVGLIGVHLPGGEFVELVPWNSELEWDVDPWGRWWLRAVSERYEALVEATCAPGAGTVLRAPTTSMGLAPFCKDTFFGQCRLQVWRRAGGTKQGPPLVDATSTTAALEVGGGPWWSAWRAKAEMKEPFRSLVTLPLDVAGLGQLVPEQLRPPGL